ncbi:MAG: LemA family protein [Phycisphaerae bacterium]
MPWLFVLVTLLVVVLGGVLFVVAVYNSLVALRNRYKNGYAQIDVQLKRRYDLIPNLVETVKGYMQHERETLEAVIAARNQAAGANQAAARDPSDGQAIVGLIAAEQMLTGQMGRMFGLMEAYPDLKADRQTSQLMEELSSTENRVAFARQAYNDAVMRYNTKRESFPSNLVAGTFGFDRAELFRIEAEQERQAVQVSLS